MGLWLPRQDAPSWSKKLAGIGLSVDGFITGDRKLKTKSIDKIVQVERAMTINAADCCAVRTDKRGLFLNNGSTALISSRIGRQAFRASPSAGKPEEKKLAND